MDINTTEVIEAVSQRVSSYLINEERGKANRLARLLKAGSDLNDGTEPVIGKDGRLHAPHDGYVWVWETVDRDGEGTTQWDKECMGGEFLPLSEGSRKIGKTSTSRITYVPLDVAEQLVLGLNHCLTIYTGQPFESRGEQRCHLYINTKCKPAVRIIEDALEAQERALQAEREAEEAAAWAAAAEVPTGRVEVTGEVISIRTNENEWGYITRTVVRDAQGFKVWGTLPSAISGAKRGDIVTFTATLTPSNDDPKFGFFKRPTKASIVAALEVAA